ncbi:MAG: hypothetical protein HOP12_10510 [Candidatus Eisenbacteria bacterium]|uniref:Tetratricopeptide repeat protein n=1 Tax=Eiseniibacteriota bacterium TaxID=2212470 RepID=A0A849SZS8_UNCEI|nr:hypothetical protein [Candidatus Eisenbacteria bacterium]
MTIAPRTRGVRSPRALGPIGFAFAACLGLAVPQLAHAADAPDAARVQRGERLPGRVLESQMLVFENVIEYPRGRSQKPYAPLDDAFAERLGRVRLLYQQAHWAAARDTLGRLLAARPHQPLVLAELAAVHAARNDWRAIEQLGRAERMATHDSLLLAGEYADALERLGRPREAAQVMLEAWIVAPDLEPWAFPSLRRLARDARGVALMRDVALAQPRRPDLARGAARIAWDAGDARTALAVLAAVEDQGEGTPLRWSVAEEMLFSRTAADSSGAIELMLDLAGDARRNEAHRLAAARGARSVAERRAGAAALAPRLTRALREVPVSHWGGDLALGLARDLRAAGLKDEARQLLADAGTAAGDDPALALERAMESLRDRVDERSLNGLEQIARSSPEAGFQFAEALFFAGRPDSALAWYTRASQDPGASVTGASLERMYLIEDADPRTALPALGRLAWQEWRGEPKQALALADSLYRVLPRMGLWAHTALALARLREATGEGRAALEPLLALADSIPADRLASIARQRAGDVLRHWYNDDRRALEQYEECLARYPRAWNAPEVRRQVQAIRKEKRF